MTDSEKFGESDRRRLEILGLLDARYRLEMLERFAREVQAKPAA